MLPSREARQLFDFHYQIKSFRIHPCEGLYAFTEKSSFKIHIIMTKQNIMDDKEVMYILRQLGIGAAIGAAFLLTLYLGGIVAHLVSGF